jgi:amidase
VSTKGIRTTLGSPIFADNVPEIDDIIVERIRGAGAITIGKTNVPEFAAGSHTFNPVFGATLNPWDRSKTAGGSSGGAAVALACGMLPIADGSDHGGSLRNPGNFNNIVGFRPSPGRVPNWPTQMPWFAHSVKGPLARTVADTALLLSAMAGPDARAPISVETPGEVFRRPLERDFSGVRVAYSPDLGGLPVDPRVRAVLAGQVQVFRDLGCQVEEVSPDLTDADDIFMTLRAWSFAANSGPLLAQHRDRIKETVVWNIEEGLRLSADDLSRAELKRGALYQRVRAFMEEYEFLICPVNQVPPFDVEIEYPTEIDGVTMENYIAWMKSAYYITVTGLPALSVPCGFTTEGLPVGVQIVGRWHADFTVLQFAHAFEQVTGVGKQRPSLVG